MSTFLIIIGILALLVLLFYRNLLITLLTSIKSKQRVTAEVEANNDTNILNIRFDVNKGRQIVVNSISIDRNLAEALKAKAPVGFKEIQHTMPNEKDFEADLSVLLDEHDESQITEDMIQDETKKQYQESLRVSDEYKSTTINWTGHFTIEKKKRNILSIPVNAIGPAKGRISFSYRFRSGFMKVLESCSVEVNRID